MTKKKMTLNLVEKAKAEASIQEAWPNQTSNSVELKTDGLVRPSMKKSEYNKKEYLDELAALWVDVCRKVYRSKWREIDFATNDILKDEAKMAWNGTSYTPLEYVLRYNDPKNVTNQIGHGQKAREKRWDEWVKNINLIELKVKAIINDCFGVDEANDYHCLKDMGADSLDFLDLSHRLETEFKLDFEIKLSESTTVKELVDSIRAAKVNQ